MRARYSELHGRVVWDNEPEWAEVVAGERRRRRRRGTEVHVTAERNFADVQMPKNYKYHAMAGGKFDSNGGCIFDSWDQIERTTAIANDHGEKVCYDAPFRRTIGKVD